jgi:hypothetical protein
MQSNRIHSQSIAVIVENINNMQYISHIIFKEQKTVIEIEAWLIKRWLKFEYFRVKRSDL